MLGGELNFDYGGQVVPGTSAGGSSSTPEERRLLRRDMAAEQPPPRALAGAGGRLVNYYGEGRDGSWPRATCRKPSAR